MREQPRRLVELMPLAHQKRLGSGNEADAALESRPTSVFIESNIVVTLLIVAAVIGAVVMVGTLIPIGSLPARALRLVIVSR
jgi:hypothetical protein